MRELLASALFVYSSLLVPSIVVLTGHKASVPQMEAGARFYNPPLFAALLAMLAAMPVGHIILS